MIDAAVFRRTHPKLTPMNARYINVYCTGCRKPPILTGSTQGFYYQAGGCSSSTYLCDECAARIYEPGCADDAFHRFNLENDKSIFA